MMSDDRPLLDRHQRSITVPRRLMPSLLAAHTGRLRHSPETSPLAAAGMLEDGKLAPLVAELIGVITNPSIVVSIETVLRAENTPALATIWRSADRAVIGHRDLHDRFRLSAIEPSLLVFHLAQVVRLVPRPSPSFSGGFFVPEQTLAVAQSMATDTPDRAERELLTAGIDQCWVDRFVATMIMRRSLWTVESVWLGDNRHREEARVVVLDGGNAGYWRLRRTGRMVSVSPIDFDRLLELLAALLPGDRVP